MVRRWVLALTAALVAVTIVSARATEVTFVMKNGERVTGQFAYNHTDHYQIVVNGQQRDYPSDEIAMISFGAGDPPRNEVARLPNVNDPPELERHTIVLKSGEMIRGKIYDFQGDTIIMDLGPNNRRTFNMADTARLYISAPGSRAVYNVNNVARGGRGGRFGANAGGAAPRPRTPAVNVEVPANATWVDSGVAVNQGDPVWFTVTGQVNMSPNQRVDAAGVPNSENRKDNPFPAANSGALLGRVGNAMFLIGTTTDPITMPATGLLMLGINYDNHRDNRDSFQVGIRR
jgi:hypothetical protein